MNDNMNAEERDILERFERDELPSAPGAEREVKEAGQPARNTFNSTESRLSRYGPNILPLAVIRRGRFETCPSWKSDEHELPAG